MQVLRIPYGHDTEAEGRDLGAVAASAAVAALAPGGLRAGVSQCSTDLLGHIAEEASGALGVEGLAAQVVEVDVVLPDVSVPFEKSDVVMGSTTTTGLPVSNRKIV